jgi:hypothetical protein
MDIKSKYNNGTQVVLWSSLLNDESQSSALHENKWARNDHWRIKALVVVTADVTKKVDMEKLVDKTLRNMEQYTQ